MKLCTIVICIVVAATTATNAQFSKKHLKILGATQENWSPGIVEPNQKNNGGIIYKLSVAVISKNGPVTLDSIIIDNLVLPLEILRKTDRNYKGLCYRRDSIQLIARKDYGTIYPKVSATRAKVIASAKSKMAGYLIYRKGSSTCLLEITTFNDGKQKSLNQ